SRPPSRRSKRRQRAEPHSRPDTAPAPVTCRTERRTRGASRRFVCEVARRRSEAIAPHRLLAHTPAAVARAGRAGERASYDAQRYGLSRWPVVVEDKVTGPRQKSSLRGRPRGRVRDSQEPTELVPQYLLEPGVTGP